jgi:hypothetical protein
LTESVILPILAAVMSDSATLTSTAQLLALAREYGRVEQIPLTTVSTRVFDDGKKLAAIEAGADIRTRRFESAVRWFSDNWPAAAVWPQAVTRPDAARADVDVAANAEPPQ